MAALRAVVALFAAVLLAAASLVAPVSELSEDRHHASLHAAAAGDHVAHGASADAARGDVKHSHPDTPGHTHCGAACHIQISDARLVLAVAYVATDMLFAPLIGALRPAAHLDGLFRPPRA